MRIGKALRERIPHTLRGMTAVATGRTVGGRDVVALLSGGRKCIHITDFEAGVRTSPEGKTDPHRGDQNSELSRLDESFISLEHFAGVHQRHAHRRRSITSPRSLGGLIWSVLSELRDDLRDLRRVLDVLGPYWRAVYSDAVMDDGGNRDEEWLHHRQAPDRVQRYGLCRVGRRRRRTPRVDAGDQLVARPPYTILQI